MSEIKVNSIKGVGASAAAITVNNTDGTCTANITNNLSNRNLIINGAMQVAQRGTSATGIGVKTIDRFGSIGSGSQAVTQSQDTDVPTGQGFSKSLKFDCTTANASPSSGDYLSIRYRIEAQDLQQLANGTSSAKKVTISFWVKSPKTGNHALGIYKPDNTQRQNTKTYSVSAANTWEKKTITYDGDTSGGGIDNDNGIGLVIDWHLLSGSDYTSVDSTSWINYAANNWAYGHAVNVLDNTANNFYITGVQLEVGSVATDFEHRSFHDELYRCYRYFQRWATGDGADIGEGFYFTSSQINATLDLLTTMRATPTLSMISGTHYYVIYSDNTADTFNSFGLDNATNQRVNVRNNSEVSGSAGNTGLMRCNNAAPNGGQIDFIAEL